MPDQILFLVAAPSPGYRDVPLIARRPERRCKGLPVFLAKNNKVYSICSTGRYLQAIYPSVATLLVALGRVG